MHDDSAIRTFCSAPHTSFDETPQKTFLNEIYELNKSLQKAYRSVKAKGIFYLDI